MKNKMAPKPGRNLWRKKYTRNSYFVETETMIIIIIIVKLFFYSANSRMVDRCAVQDIIINVLINTNVNYINLYKSNNKCINKYK